MGGNIFEALINELGRGFARYRLNGNLTYEDPDVNNLFQSARKVENGQGNLADVAEIERCLTKCQQAGKDKFNYPRIENAITQIKSQLSEENTSSKKNRP